MWAHSRIPMEVIASDLGAEFSPGVAGDVDDLVINVEGEAERQLPRMNCQNFDGAQFWGGGRQEDRLDVAGHCRAWRCCAIPARSSSGTTWAPSARAGVFLEVGLHGLGIVPVFDSIQAQIAAKAAQSEIVRDWMHDRQRGAARRSWEGGIARRARSEPIKSSWGVGTCLIFEPFPRIVKSLQLQESGRRGLVSCKLIGAFDRDSVSRSVGGDAAQGAARQRSEWPLPSAARPDGSRAGEARTADRPRFLEDRFGAFYSDKTGTRRCRRFWWRGFRSSSTLHDLSDEDLCTRWVENPYHQLFCSEESSGTSWLSTASLTRCRQRPGEERLAALVQDSLSVATRTGAAKHAESSKVFVDTTVQPIGRASGW